MTLTWLSRNCGVATFPPKEEGKKSRNLSALPKEMAKNVETSALSRRERVVPRCGTG